MERLTQNNFDYCLEMCEPETQLDCAFYMSQTECVCGEAAIYNKLREYENAEREGRLVVLPCKVGDTVYQKDHCGEIYEAVVQSVVIDKRRTIFITSGIGFDETSVGKTVFLTRAEAEKAMEVSEDA